MAFVGVTLLHACGTPVGVKRIDPTVVQRERGHAGRSRSGFDTAAWTRSTFVVARMSLPEGGTLIIAALLLLAILFTGAWIFIYVEPGGDPRILFPWFGGAAAFIIVFGALAALWQSRRR